MTTNNGVETINKNLKAFFLKISGTGTVSSLVQTIVTQFIPEKIKGYESLNYRYRTCHKAYSKDVPAFLQNRPREIVLHCLKNITAASHFSAQDIVERNDGTCLVRSEQSNTFHSVDLTKPSCECEAFQLSYLPCKHIFAIFSNTKHSWDSLPLIYTLSPYLTLDTFDDVRGVDGSRGAQSLEDGEAQSLMQVGSRGAESTEDGTESLVHDKGAESLEDGVDIMPQRIKSAQLKLREELKMFSDDTYLCNDLETLTRSTEVLINLRKTFVTQCRRENGLMLNNQKEIVMVRKDSEVLRALPANKRRVAKTKKRKWNQGMLFFCWLYFVKMLTLSHWSSCPLLPLLSVTGRT